MAKINNDTIAGFIMLAYSLIHIFYLTPDQVEMHQSNTVLAMSPRLFCYITAGTLGVLSAVLITMSFSPKSQKAAADAKTSILGAAHAGPFLHRHSLRLCGHGERARLFCQHYPGDDRAFVLFRSEELERHFAVSSGRSRVSLFVFCQSSKSGHARWPLILINTIPIQENHHGQFYSRL
jgi:hypothetical protein